MRSMILGAMVGALLSSAGAAQDVLGGDQLETIASRVRDYVPRDQFDAPPAMQSVSGKAFQYTVAPLERGPDNSICRGFPAWGYWPQEGKIEVGADDATLLSDRLLRHDEFVFPRVDARDRSPTELTFDSFTCTKTKYPDYVGTNGYGAKMMISKQRDQVIAVATFEKVALDRKWKPFTSIVATGDQARVLSKALRVRVSGLLSEWAPGTPVRCGTDTTEPTARYSKEHILEICMFQGRITKVEIINADTGGILYSAQR